MSRLSVNDMMGIFEEAEVAGLIEINDSDKLQDWLHDEQGYLYREEMKED